MLPAAAPGIVTGSILGLSRAAGETAPILFTAAVFFAPVPRRPLDQVMALPYHLYIMATQAVKPAPDIVWGTALVLVAGVSVVNVARRRLAFSAKEEDQMVDARRHQRHVRAERRLGRVRQGDGARRRDACTSRRRR